ncbi:MAG TPA: FIST N-terminal domain-containing protein [Sporichthyaceae bacterium]|jgi:small ligand-binding sensory domain FIST|nr:FIST N-terminal domain-containing protein [Sporichthyaceae bacterium]
MTMHQEMTASRTSRFGSAMVRVGSGASDLVAAAEQAARAALDSLDGAVPDLSCVFVCGRAADIPAAGAAACEALGGGAVVGCSAPGVIGPGAGVEGAPAVAVWAAVLPGATLRTFHLRVIRNEDSLTVLGLPESAEESAVGVVLADPRTFPIDGFVAGSNDALPGLPLVGGLAMGADGGPTWLCQDGIAHDSGAVGVLIGGDVELATVVSQGCRPIGPTMAVTRAEGNELLELAGKPAGEKLQEILAGLLPDEQALALTGLQIGIAMDEYADDHGRGDFLIRGVAGLYPDRGSVVVGDVVEVGRTVRFQVRDATAAHEELAEVLARLRADSGSPGGALLFSCNGRGRAMFSSADHDPQVLAQELGVQPVAGFFAGGEIGPVGGRNHLHGFTASILTFGAGAPSEN